MTTNFPSKILLDGWQGRALASKIYQGFFPKIISTVEQKPTNGEFFVQISLNDVNFTGFVTY